MVKSIIETIKENNEIISLNNCAITGLKQRNKEFKLNMDPEGFLESGLYVLDLIQINKEMGIKRINENIQLQKETDDLYLKMDNMLKYFNADKPPIKLGRILKLLAKQYNNPFRSDNFKVYSCELWEIINYAIDNNKPFYLQFKTLINECLKVYDYDLNRWI